MKKVKALALSAGVMAAVSGLLLVLAALIIAKLGALPRGIQPVLTMGIGCLAIFLGGFTGSLYAKEKGILLGIASGALYALCAAALSLAIFQSSLGLGAVGKLAAFLLSGAIGGILGVNRKSKVKF